MAGSPTDRELVRRARRHLDDWLYAARRDAFEALFSGEDPRLSEEELQILDRIDSRMNRERRDGLWGTDQYGILATGALGEDRPPRVVCVHHPEIPEDFVGPDGLDDETEERLNDALWDYCELVAANAQEELSAFLERES